MESWKAEKKGGKQTKKKKKGTTNFHFWGGKKKKQGQNEMNVKLSLLNLGCLDCS